MALPKVTYPTGVVTLPKSKKTIRYRTFTAREEKILLMAKQSREEQDILQSVKQVVQNCVVEPKGFDVNKTSTVEVEFLFIRMRMLSVSATAPMSYIDNSDKQTYDVEVDLEKVTVEGGTGKQSFKINDTLAFDLRYPVAAIWDDPVLFGDEALAFIRLVARCVDKIYDGDQVIDATLHSLEDVIEFVESLPIKCYDEVKAFFTDLPHLDYTVSYRTVAGEDRKIPLRTLTDFFTFA